MLYDPYHILNIQQDASIKEVKKAFKKIIKKSDPDKFQGAEKDKMNEYLFTVNKAYNMLCDKKKLDKFNSVSKESEEVVAIPKKLVDNGWFLFAVYIVVLCIFLPIFGFTRWKKSINCNSLGIKYESVDNMYKKSKNDLLGKENVTGVRNVLWLICECEEIKGIKKLRANNWVINEIKMKSLEDSSEKKIESNEEIKKFAKFFIEQNYAYPLKETKNYGYMILMDHLFRTNIFIEKERIFVVDKCIRSITVLKKIAIAKNLKELLETIFVVDKMIHQSVFDLNYSLLQYPGITFESIFLNKAVKKEELCLPIIKIKDINAFVAKTGIKKLNKKPEENDTKESELEHEDAENSISDSNKEKSILATGSNTIVKNTNNLKHFKVEKESLITVKLTLERPFVNQLYNDKENNSFLLKMKGETDLEMLNSLGKSIKTPVHAPFLPLQKNVSWNVIFIYNNSILKFNPVFSDFEGVKDIFVEFEGEKNGSSKLKIMVKC
ncbi:secretory subunit, partial [Conglomerata obtusa]